MIVSRKLVFPMLLLQCLAQTDLLPSDCVGNISTFPNCEKSNKIIAKCNQIDPDDQAGLISCMCNQDFYSAWVGCQGEFRLCGLTTTFDSDFESFLVEWHKKCDKKLTAPLTTPPLPTPSTVLDQETCQTFMESCVRLDQATSSCSKSYTQAADLSSCRCQSSIVSLASVCEIDGSISCLLQTPTQVLWESQFCPAAASVFPSTPAKTTQNPVITGPNSVIATPTGTISFGPRASTVATSSPTGGADSSLIMGKLQMGAIFGAMGIILL